MKNLSVVFKSDMTLSYDGINTKEYKKGEVYTASHPQEQRVFDSMLANGSAELPTVKTESEPAEIKVSKPRAKKSKSE